LGQYNNKNQITLINMKQLKKELKNRWFEFDYNTLTIEQIKELINDANVHFVHKNKLKTTLTLKKSNSTFIRTII
jgi:hypothetical protein